MPTVYYTNDTKSQFTSIFVYGMSGSGKTPLAATLPPNESIILCSEPGLKSLQSIRMPYLMARDYKEAMEALDWVDKQKVIKYVFFDSSSALSENICRAEMKTSKDPRNYSPATFNKTMEIINRLLMMPSNGRNVIVTSKAIAPASALPGILIEPFAVVPKLGPALPYHFDNVLFLERRTDPATGQEYGLLTCRANEFCVARNRTGMLAKWEPANLSHIIAKENGAIQ